MPPWIHGYEGEKEWGSRNAEVAGCKVKGTGAGFKVKGTGAGFKVQGAR